MRVDHGTNETTLVEVKLSEQEFGRCSKAGDAGNPLRATCAIPDLALEEIANGCYLVQIAARPYFRLLTEPLSLISASRLQAFSHDGCPLRGGLYQIARNLMMVQHLRNSGTAVRFAVVAPSADLNPALHGHRSLHGYSDVLSFLRSVVQDREQDAVRFIDFAEVVARTYSSDPEAVSRVDYMRRKYIEPLGAAPLHGSPVWTGPSPSRIGLARPLLWIGKGKGVFLRGQEPRTTIEVTKPASRLRWCVCHSPHYQWLFAAKTRVIHPINLRRRDGRFGPDTCLPASPGNGKGPPEGVPTFEREPRKSMQGGSSRL